MNDYDYWQVFADSFQPVFEFMLSPVGMLLAVVFIVCQAGNLIDWVLPVRTYKGDGRTYQTNLNKRMVEEWKLASGEELATLDWQELRKLLDSRNINSDAIIALTVELDDPINRDDERRKKIEAKIRKLRLAPVKELEKQADARKKEILQNTTSY